MNAPTTKPALTAPQRLRAVLTEPGLVVMPAVYDGLSAKLTAAAGFQTAFLSGSCVAASRLGGSDLDLLSFTEMRDSFEMVRGAYPYRNLSRKEFDDIVKMLAEGFSTRRGRRSALIHHDAIGHRILGRRGARLAAITSGGAIADTADYAVIQEPESLRVGTLDEHFAVESSPGDTFQLGNTTWRILKVDKTSVRVEDAKGIPPTLPFWFGEAPARSARGHEYSVTVNGGRAQLRAPHNQVRVPELMPQVSGLPRFAVGVIQVR